MKLRHCALGGRLTLGVLTSFVLTASAFATLSKRVRVPQKLSPAFDGDVVEQGTVESLLASLRTGSAMERAQAALALRNEGEKALPFLLEALPGADSKTGVWIISLLSEIEGESARSALRKCLDHSDARLRCAASMALGRVGEEVSEFAQVLLRRGDKKERRAVIMHFATRTDSESIGILARALRDEDWVVRNKARRGLLALIPDLDDAGRGDEINDVLLMSHASHLPGPKTDVIAVLAKRQDPRVAAALVLDLSNVDPEERGAAASALGHFEGDNIEQALLNVSTLDPVGTVRWHGVRSLGLLGGIKVIPTLIRSLRDQDRAVRQEALLGLTRISGVDHGFHYWLWVEWWKEFQKERDIEDEESFGS